MIVRLTREQVALILNQLTDSGTVDDENYQSIMSHDAALRAQLEQAKGERDLFRRSMMERLNDYCEARKQLAEAQAENERLKEALEKGIKDCTYFASEARRMMDMEGAREAEYGVFVLNEVKRKAQAALAKET